MVQNIFRNFLAVDFVLSVGPKMIFIKKGISLGNQVLKTMSHEASHIQDSCPLLREVRILFCV